MGVAVLRRLESAEWSPYGAGLAFGQWGLAAAQMGVSKGVLKRGVRAGRWVTLTFRGGSVTVEQSQRQASEQQPVRLTQYKGRDIWAYRGRVYSADADLSAADVAALSA